MGWVVFRPHLYLHAAALAVVAALSYWGQGAAFLVLYAAVLVVTGILVLIVHGISWLRSRLSTAQAVASSARGDAVLPWRATGWILRATWVVLGCAVLTGGIVAIVASRSEPIGSFPGAKLSGERVAQPVEDWGFLDEFEMIQVEVSPAAPRSVNVHAFVQEGDLYVGADFYFPFKRWVHEALRDDRVTVRARGKLYPLSAVRISDPDRHAALMSELERRLHLWRGVDPESAPGFQTQVWLFRLDPRESSAE